MYVTAFTFCPISITLIKYGISNIYSSYLGNSSHQNLKTIVEMSSSFVQAEPRYVCLLCVSSPTGIRIGGPQGPWPPLFIIPP